MRGLDRRAFISMFGGTLAALGLDPSTIYEELPEHWITFAPLTPSDENRLLADLMQWLMDEHLKNFARIYQQQMIYNPEPIAWEEEKLT